MKSKSDTVAIEIKNLSKIYKDLTAVDNVSFSVKKEEIFKYIYAGRNRI